MAQQITVLLLSIALVGCAHSTINPVVIENPSVEIPNRPEGQTPLLSEDAKPNEVVRALMEDVLSCQGYAIQLETILKGYQK